MTKNIINVRNISQYLKAVKPNIKKVTIYFEENTFLPKKRFEEYDLDKFDSFFLDDCIIFQNESISQIYPLSEINYIEATFKK
ncbi:MAG: hypothetical protein EAX96_10510 [Candidatus Lokiarchaeota archaeon]|nr:hypothetical protein [Candidatus Lokiarchaeota archaeon]